MDISPKLKYFLIVILPYSIIFFSLSSFTINEEERAVLYIVNLLNILPFFVLITPAFFKSENFNYEKFFKAKGFFRKILALIVIMSIVILGAFVILNLILSPHYMMAIILAFIPSLIVVIIILGYTTSIKLRQNIRQRRLIGLIVPIIVILTNAIPRSFLGISSGSSSDFSFYFTLLSITVSVIMWTSFLIAKGFFNVFFGILEEGGNEGAGALLLFIFSFLGYMYMWPILIKLWVPIVEDQFFKTELLTVGFFLYGMAWGLLDSEELPIQPLAVKSCKRCGVDVKKNVLFCNNCKEEVKQYEKSLQTQGERRVVKSVGGVLRTYLIIDGQRRRLVKCSNCSTEILRKLKSCPNCNAPQEFAKGKALQETLTKPDDRIHCHNCGHQNEAESKFCKKCGNSLI